MALVAVPVGSAQAAAPGSRSAPAAAVDPATHAQEVFWRTPGGTLKEGHYTNHWATYRFPGWGSAASAPAVGIDPRTDHRYVFWEGADGYIHEAWYTHRWHCCQDFVSWGRTSGAPAVAVGNDEQQYVFWRTANGSIHEAHHTKVWRTYAFGHWRTASAPAAAVDPVNDHQYVLWRGPNGKITESRYAGGWHGPVTMSAWGQSAGAPTVGVADDSQQYVFWRAPSGAVEEAHHAHTLATYSFPRWSTVPGGFVSGTDSWPMPVGGSGPYAEPKTGGSYGGYVGMIGNWALWLRCQGGFLAWSKTNSRQADANRTTYGIGIGTAAYWFMGGPGVDPNYNGTAREAYVWGRRQAQRALADVSHKDVIYKVLFMDIELPGIRPAPDNGWDSVYTSPCSGRTRRSRIPAAVDRADFNGFWNYVAHQSAYTPGVYSSPAVWRKIFGDTRSASIPHTDEWTYEPETTDLSRAPSEWCLPGSSSCAQFFGGVTRTSRYALMWQWSGGDASRNGVGDFDQIDITNAG